MKKPIKKPSKKKPTKKIKKESPGKYWLCEKCAAEQGGHMAKNHLCTVTYGVCGWCNKEAPMLVPWVDFDWKNDKKKNRLANMMRD